MDVELSLNGPVATLRLNRPDKLNALTPEMLVLMIEHLERIEREPENESLRYFVRLATLHEDMHAEAFHYTHQTLGYPDPLEEEAQKFFDPSDLEIPAGKFTLGAERGKDESKRGEPYQNRALNLATYHLHVTNLMDMLLISAVHR